MTTMKHDPDSLPGRDVDMPASPPGSDYSESPPPKERKAKPKAAPKAPKVKAEVAGDSDGRAPKSSPKKSAWTNERRAQLLEYIIDQGTKSGNLQFIADQVSWCLAHTGRCGC